MKHLRPSGFTLMELLVVTGIIAALAAIAVPNFLEAQTRGKVAAAKANLKTLTNALEIYAADNGAYPPNRASFPDDPLGLIAGKQLAVLLHPIAYVGEGSLRDPFGTVRAQLFLPRMTASVTSRAPGDFPTVAPRNDKKDVTYYHYPSLAERFSLPEMNVFGAGVVSVGPDLEDSLGAYRPLPTPLFHSQFGFTGLDSPVDTLYDPTNGTVSEGDIADFAGGARRFAEP